MHAGKHAVYYQLTELVGGECSSKPAQIELREIRLIWGVGDNLKMIVGISWAYMLRLVPMMGGMEYRHDAFIFDMTVREYNEAVKDISDWELGRRLILADNPHLDIAEVTR